MIKINYINQDYYFPEAVYVLDCEWKHAIGRLLYIQYNSATDRYQALNYSDKAYFGFWWVSELITMKYLSLDQYNKMKAFL